VSRKPSSLARSGAFVGVFSLSLSMLPVTGHAAGGDAQAAMRPATPPVVRPADLASRNPAPGQAPDPNTPVLPAARPELDCLIEPNMSVELATSVSGIVKIVNVDRGDIIKTGQVLAQLEAEVEKANVARERARAEFATKKYHRMRELYKEQMVSAQQMEEAKADSELAAAELRKAVEMLNQRTVYAPFNGVVVDRFVSPGELLESKKVLKVAQINPLSVEVIVPISMLGEFKLGGQVRVAPEGPMAGPYEARVKLVDRVVDAASGSFRVRLALPNPRHQISAGVRCKAQIMAPAMDTAKAKEPPRAVSKAKAAKVPAKMPKTAKPGVAKADAPTAPNGETVQPRTSAAESEQPAGATNQTQAGAAIMPVASTGSAAATESSADNPATAGVPPASTGNSKAEAHEPAVVSGQAVTMSEEAPIEAPPAAAMPPAANAPAGDAGSTPKPDHDTSALNPAPEKTDAASSEGQKPGAANEIPSTAAEAGVQL
jgi:membrane fusion protein, multidrug efflux system